MSHKELYQYNSFYFTLNLMLSKIYHCLKMCLLGVIFRPNYECSVYETPPSPQFFSTELLMGLKMETVMREAKTSISALISSGRNPGYLLQFQVSFAWEKSLFRENSFRNCFLFLFVSSILRSGINRLNICTLLFQYHNWYCRKIQQSPEGLFLFYC